MRILKIGSKGEEVRNLQKKLKSLNYICGPIDGIFGPQTSKAVKEFQKDNRLIPNGVVSFRTWQLINQALEKKFAPKPSKPKKDIKLGSIVINPSTQGYNTSPHIDGYSEAKTAYIIAQSIARHATFPCVVTDWKNCKTKEENYKYIYKAISLANTIRAKYFISIHTDAAGNPPGITGSLVLCSSLQGARLADKIVPLTCEKMKIRYKGRVFRYDIAVLTRVRMPSILIEVLNHTDPDDCELLKNPKWLVKYGKALAQSIQALLIK